MSTCIQLHLWETETSTTETPTNNENSPLTVNISASLKEQFKTTCYDKRKNMTEVLNQLITDWVEKQLSR